MVCASVISCLRAGSLRLTEVYAEQDDQAEGELEDKLNDEQGWLD